MIVIGLDPGTEQSAICVFDGVKITEAWTESNENVRVWLKCHSSADRTLVIEKLESMGMPIGIETMDTIFWSGRFAEAWDGPWDRLARRPIKLHLCGNARANDANIRQAIYDRFGPGREKACGRKSSPGPLFGVKGHEMAALAVALTWHDLHGGADVPRP